MPEHYTITMEIAKDRTTEASVQRCTQAVYQLGLCPSGAVVGDEFISRTLNEACQRMVSIYTLLFFATYCLVYFTISS